MIKRSLYALSLIVGVSLFVWVIARFGGVAKALELVRETGWTGVALFVANAAAVLAIPALGWTILMRGEGLRVTLWTALKANFMGFPLNFIAPTMYLGAEPLKMLYVAQAHGESRGRVLATIVVAKFQEVGAILLVMLVSAALSVRRVDFGGQQEVIMVGFMLAICAGFSLTLYAFIGNFKPTVKVVNALAAMGVAKRKLARLRTRAEEMEHLIRMAFTKRWKTFIAAQAVTLLSAFSIMMRPWIYFYFTRERLLLGTEQLCAIYLVTNLISSLPHTPGGLGIFDGGMVALFPALGLDTDHAAGFALMSRVSDIILLLLGAWLIMHYGLQSLARRVAKGEEKASLREAERGEMEEGRVQ